MTADTTTPTRIYREGDPDMPEEFKTLPVRMLTHHLENSTNPHYTELLNKLWTAGMNVIPDEKAQDQLREAHAAGSRARCHHRPDPAQPRRRSGDQRDPAVPFRPADRDLLRPGVFQRARGPGGLLFGETWEGVPYEPLLTVADRLHKDEVFHATFGMNNLRRVCSTPEGMAEANEKIKFWWPAALDMFGRSDSNFSDKYVTWNLRKKSNEELRQQYIADTRPMLLELGIDVPDDAANRRFL